MLNRRIAPAFLVAVALGAVTIIAQDQDRGAPPTDARDAVLPAVTKSPYRFTPTNTGRLVDIQSPVGTSFWHAGEYELCDALGGNYEGSSDFYLYSISQSNGAGTLPLQITARTLNNAWQIKWSYTVDNVENELMVTANVKRLIAPTTYAYLEVGGDVYGSAFESSAVDANLGSAWWERLNYGTPFSMNLVTTSNVARYAWIADAFDFTIDNDCAGGYFNAAPQANVDMSGIGLYYTGNLSSGSSRKVQYQIRRHQ